MAQSAGRRPSSARQRRSPARVPARVPARGAAAATVGPPYRHDTVVSVAAWPRAGCVTPGVPGVLGLEPNRTAVNPLLDHRSTRTGTYDASARVVSDDDPQLPLLRDVMPQGLTRIFICDPSGSTSASKPAATTSSSLMTDVRALVMGYSPRETSRMMRGQSVILKHQLP